MTDMNKTITVDKRIDPSLYVNAETGETMLSELEGVSLKTSKKTDLYVIDSKEYVIIDSKGIQYICSELSAVDCQRYTTMANWLKTEFNIVYNNNVPHSLDTLSAALGIDKDSATRLVNRLVKKGLMAYVVCAPSGFIQRLYMLNPSVVRKRRTFNKELMMFFKSYKIE